MAPFIQFAGLSANILVCSKNAAKNLDLIVNQHNYYFQPISLVFLHNFKKIINQNNEKTDAGLVVRKEVRFLVQFSYL